MGGTQRVQTATASNVRQPDQLQGSMRRRRQKCCPSRATDHQTNSSRPLKTCAKAPSADHQQNASPSHLPAFVRICLVHPLLRHGQLISHMCCISDAVVCPRENRDINMLRWSSPANVSVCNIRHLFLTHQKALLPFFSITSPCLRANLSCASSPPPWTHYFPHVLHLGCCCLPKGTTEISTCSNNQPHRICRCPTFANCS